MISVVIPAHNEAAGIRKTLEEICAALSNTEYEIIVVDDQSSDGTFEVVAEQQLPLKNKTEPHDGATEGSPGEGSPVRDNAPLGKKFQRELLEQQLPLKTFQREAGTSRIRVLRLSQRKGSHTALRAGISVATGDAILCIAADGQDDPATIPKMVDKWRQGAQIVWALRINAARTDEPFLYRCAALFFYRVLKFMTRAQNDTIDLSRVDFYLIDRRVAEAIRACQECHTSLFGLIAWSGFRQDSVEYDRRQRLQGRSKWNFSSRWNLATDWVIAFSAIPLRAMVWLGLAIGLLGFVYACIVMFSYFFLGHRPEGWSSLMIVILFLGGINIFMLGVVGEYLWNTLSEARKRPLFFIERDSMEKGGHR